MATGDKAPGFSLPDQNGRQVSLSDHAGGWLVLYFYPKDNTSGCTREAQDFSALKEEFEKEGCSILGVSPDPSESHLRFIEKQGLTITLLSDLNKETLTDYGAWGTKKNYGREYMGVVRSTLLIDPDGNIAEIWRNVTVRKKTATCEILHAQRVLERLRQLKAVS
jgi:peroxiredoxin Q/BCP